MFNLLMHISINGPEANHVITMAVKKWQTTKERQKVTRSVYTAIPKSCDVGCHADIQNRQILQPEVGTSMLACSAGVFWVGESLLPYLPVYNAHFFP